MAKAAPESRMTIAAYNKPLYLLRNLQKNSPNTALPGKIHAATRAGDGPPGVTFFAEPPEVSGDAVSTVNWTVAVPFAVRLTLSFEKLQVTEAGRDAQPSPSWSAKPSVEANVSVTVLYCFVAIVTDDGLSDIW